MKTDNDSRRTITITHDQSSEIEMRIAEARALMYILGTVVRKESHGILDAPDKEVENGICALVQTVGQSLSEAFKSATKGGAL